MNLLPEIVVDCFAGGGGASEGMERALRRVGEFDLLNGAEPHVSIAINHDAEALAMHVANHPATLHLPVDIWRVDPRSAVNGNPVGLLWASPDCRHHSKAKGGKPVSKSVRDLAWVIVHWAEQVKPRIICLENVGEFRDWGPLVPDEKGELRPDKARKGETFKLWANRFKALGYRVEWRKLRACDFGTPTIRERLYMIMRCDGLPIVWPKPSHGDPKSGSVKSGKLKPWPVAADIIDWDRPCPSILMDRDEADAYKSATGIKIIRPLAHNTMARIAKGIKRYVLDAAEPFIVTCNHSGTGFRGQGLNEPFATVTMARDAHGLVVPHVMTMRNSGKPHTGADEPTHTVTAGGAGLSVVEAGLAPCFVSVSHGDSGGRREYSALEPFGTVTENQSRAVAAAYLAQHNTGVIGRCADKPVSTIMSRGTTQQLVAAHMMSLKGSDRRAGSVDAPHPAITAGGQHSGLVTLPLLNAYYGADKDGAEIGAPMRTISTKDRFGLVDCNGAVPPMSDEQASRARMVAEFLRQHGCWDGGEFVHVGRFVIVDIGMRMLTPRELARAQGFGDDYILAAPLGGRGFGNGSKATNGGKRKKQKTLTETSQRHKIGNSVCPPLSDVLAFANYRPQRRARYSAPQGWLFDTRPGVGQQIMEAAQ